MDNRIELEQKMWLANTHSKKCADVAIQYAIDVVQNLKDRFFGYYNHSKANGYSESDLQLLRTAIKTCGDKISELQSLLKQPQP